MYYWPPQSSLLWIRCHPQFQIPNISPAKDCGLAPFLRDLNQREALSEIKPPLKKPLPPVTLMAMLKNVMSLTPQLITLVSNHFQNKTLHVIIDEVHLIQLDEFQTICTIFASNCQEQQPLSLENFAPGTV